SRDGTLTGLGEGRGAGLPVPRLAVRRGRPLRGDPATGGPDPRPGQGSRRGIQGKGTLWIDLGCPRGTPLAAAGGSGARGQRLDRGSRGSVPLDGPRRPA